MFKTLLLLFLATVVLSRCPWSHYNITKNISDITPCDAGLSIQLTSEDSLYMQIAYDVSNVNLTTPFNLSKINITRDGVSKIFQANRFHLHHISKHVIHGKLHDIELHINHHNDQEDSNIIYAVFFDAYPGDFPDDFDHWALNTTVPVQQKFPIRLHTPSKALYYDDDPECNLNYKTAFYINPIIYRIKQSNFDKVAKLIDATETPGLGDPVFIPKDQACSIKKTDLKQRQKAGEKEEKKAQREAEKAQRDVQKAQREAEKNRKHHFALSIQA